MTLHRWRGRSEMITQSDWQRKERAMETSHHEQFSDFTPQARQLWAKVPAHIRPKLLSNVYCGECRGETTIVNYSGSVR